MITPYATTKVLWTWGRLQWTQQNYHLGRGREGSIVNRWREREGRGGMEMLTKVANRGTHGVAAQKEKLHKPWSYETRPTRHAYHSLTHLSFPEQALFSLLNHFCRFRLWTEWRFLAASDFLEVKEMLKVSSSLALKKLFASLTQ